jgi:predicted ATPase/DNA-binding CsgD family transcriptional regulator
MIASHSFQLTPFIGREDELSRLLALLDQPENRLITILGEGGVGKTRLALAAEERWLQQSGPPVISVALDGPQSRQQLSITLANAIGCNLYEDGVAETQLLGWMRDKQFLLLLDNLEYAQDGAGFILNLLNKALTVRVLGTSRERLGLRGETAFTLKGFSIPEWKSLSEASCSPAVRLFVNAAQRVRIDFALSDTNLTYIRRICQHVEGLPLAIELAAAWVDTLSVKEIVDEIESSYIFLSSDFQDLPERHRSMVATFEASWIRLSSEDQASLIRMSIFQGGFTRSAAFVIAGANIHTLQSLVNKSLVKHTDDERYSIHELLRQYLSDKLMESDQLYTVQAAHSRYYLDWLHEADPLIKGRDQAGILGRIEHDFANVRLAWENALNRGDYSLVNGALESLFWFCMMRTHYYDFEQLIERVQQLTAHTGDVYLLQARACLFRYWIERWRRGRFDEAEVVVSQLKAMLPLFRDTHDIAVCLLVLGDASRYFATHSNEAAVHLSESLKIFREAGDDFYAAWALHFLGRHALMTEGLTAAIQFQQQSLELRERCGDLNGALYAEFNLGDYLMQMGDLDRSTALIERMLEHSRENGERSNEMLAIALLSIIAFLRADFTLAGELSARVSIAARNLNHPLGRTYAILVECLIAIMNGDALNAAERLRTLEITRQHGVIRYWINLALAIAQVSSDANSSNRSTVNYLHEVLNYVHTVQGTGVMECCLPVCAVAIAQKGELSWSASLMGLADKINKTRWSAAWSSYTELHTTLESQLGTEAFEDQLQAGQQRDLASTVKILLTSTNADLVKDSLFSPQILSANQALEDPLSDRELEVLMWIARGLQNAEIADQLVVEMSTVKKHVSHVYSKLGVTTRAQAILKGQKLGLV